MYYAAGMWGKKVHSAIPMPVKDGNGSPKKNSRCCSKLQLLEGVLFFSTLTHILVLSIGASILIYGHRKFVEFGGYEFYSSQTAPDLIIIGTVGSVFSILAIVGVWKRSREFLIPMIFYLLVFLLVDFVSFVAYFFHNSWQSDDLYEDMSNLEVLRIGNNGSIEMVNTGNKDMTTLIICLFIKIMANTIFLKLLLDVYRKNLSMRSNRSPLRTQTKSVNVNLETSPPVKHGKYVMMA